MDKKCYDAVIKEMQVLLDGQKFSLDGEIYKNENTAVAVEYDEEKKLFLLKKAELSGNSVPEFATISSWLFDESQTAKDAAAVGVDFADTLRASLGLKKEKTGNINVSLPVAEKGDEINILALTQKLLAFFPQYKDAYKAEVAAYGKYLYLDFMVSKFVPEIKALLLAKNKKQLKKLFDMLDEMYVDGDSVCGDMVVAMIAAAVFGEDEALATAKEYLAEDAHLKISVEEMLNRLKHSKKLREALIK